VSRFHIRPEAVRGDRVAFDAQETHHLARVLRLRAGDLVQAVDGAGHELTVRLTRVGAREAEGAVLARAARTTESRLHLTLAQGVAKGDKLEGVIRMATELGAARIVPLITERTVVSPEAAARRLVRWRRVAKEAAKQSGRAVIPEVAAAGTLDAWLAARAEGGLLLCLWENEPVGLDDRLPFVAPALHRFLEELPAPGNGLNRTEQSILDEIADGTTSPIDLFHAIIAREPAAFMGDWSFFRLLDDLASCDVPLIAGLAPPGGAGDDAERFEEAVLELTMAGEDVVAGDQDHVALSGLDRWWAGTRLQGRSVWRYDRGALRLVPPAAPGA